MNAPTTPPPHPAPPKEIVTQARHLDKSVINKNVDLSLEWFGLFKAYKVISITSTTWYKPGDWLSEEVVTQCCQTKGWNVTMAHDDFFKNALMSIFQFPQIALPGPTL